MVYTQCVNIQHLPFDYTRRDFAVSKRIDAEDLYNSPLLEQFKYSFHITLYIVGFSDILAL